MSEYRFLLIIIIGLLIEPVASFLRLENITVTQGERVQFRCQLPRNFSRRENILQWKKSRPNDDDLIISINGKVPKTLEKFYQTDLNDQWSTLEIFHVDRPDSTSYFCQTFETQTILCQYNLVVLIQPEFPSLTINEEIIEEDQLVTLTCSSSNGNPSPEYIWFRNGTLLTSPNAQVSVTSNSSIYTFRASRLDNQVKYQCQISNQALVTPIRLEKYLHVKYRPNVKIVEHPILSASQQDKVIVMEYTELKLTCLIDANPAATSIYWTINGTTILSRDLTVHFPRLTAEQTGIYTCVVENPIGKTNQSITVDVQYAPRVRPVDSRLIVNRSNSALLRCSVDANPLPFQIIWFKNGYEIFRQNQLSDLRIDHVERNDSGLYTCTIFNRFKDNSTRNGSSTMELIVQSRPILETTISKMAAEVGQSITLTCRVSGQPKPQISWKRNEQMIPCDEIIDDKCHLRLMKMSEKDFGSYRCIAENLLGREEWTYTIVSRGKPETPHDIRVAQVTSSSFKVQFSPSFDGGAGPQHFLLEVTLNDRNKTINSTIINQQLPFNTYEYTVKDLNESSLYLFRLKAINIYGESPWSTEETVQTLESIVTADDLPQLHVVSYHSKEHFLHFDYLPGDDRWIKIHNDHLCLHVRQSNDGLNYQSIDQCLPIQQNRVQWTMQREYPYLKLSICSKKQRQICGQEIEMKEDLNNRTSTAMMIGIVVTSCFLLLIIFVLIAIFCCRWKKQRLGSNRTTANKFGINGLDKGVKPIISEPRLQNPYLLYSNSHSHSSPYDFSTNEYQQRKGTSSFSQSVDHVDRDVIKDELSVHDTCSSYGTATRTATIRASPHWLMNNGGGSSSRSGSNPSSELSCLTQNTNLIFGSNDTHATAIPVTHYGFPTTVASSSATKSHSLINGTNTIRSSSFDQQQQQQQQQQQNQSSSNNSTPNRMKKLFYEVVV